MDGSLVTLIFTINGAVVTEVQHDRGFAIGFTPAASLTKGFVGAFNFGELAFPPAFPYTTVQQWLSQ